MHNTYYRHIKSQGIYRVEGKILNKSTNEQLILYQSVKNHQYYVRTVHDFNQNFVKVRVPLLEKKENHD